MPTAASASALLLPGAKRAPLDGCVDFLDLLPLKVHLSDASSVSDDHSDTHDDDPAPEPRFVSFPGAVSGFPGADGSADPASPPGLWSRAQRRRQERQQRQENDEMLQRRRQERQERQEASAPPVFGLPSEIGLPPGLDAPPGLGLLVAGGFTCLKGAAAHAGRTPLRSQASVFSPLSSQAEAFVPKGLAPTGGSRPPLGGAGPGALTAGRPRPGALTPGALTAGPAGLAPRVSGSTTVMMGNIPLSYTCDSLIDLLDSRGYSEWLDFVYVPIKRSVTEVLGVGYAFVNITSPERAEEFMRAFEGFDGWESSSSAKACTMSWSMCQGLGSNIDRFRNSPFMRDGVPEVYKPVLLKGGVRIPFPKPTKPLRTLRLRNFRDKLQADA